MGMAVVEIRKEFDIRIDLGYGEFLKLGGAEIQHEADCLVEGMPGTKCDFTAKTVGKEYLPYWRWFWEELADDARFSSDNQLWLEIGDIKIPLKSIEYGWR